MLQKSPMFAYVPCKDLSRARSFYEGTLGFAPGRELEGGVSYECSGKTSCFLYQTPNAGTSLASQAFWQVEDIEREVSELKSKGVVFQEYGFPNTKDGITTAGGAKAAWFKDTEGNIMAIIQDV